MSYMIQSCWDIVKGMVRIGFSYSLVSRYLQVLVRCTYDFIFNINSVRIATGLNVHSTIGGLNFSLDSHKREQVLLIGIFCLYIYLVYWIICWDYWGAWYKLDFHIAWCLDTCGYWLDVLYDDIFNINSARIAAGLNVHWSWTIGCLNFSLDSHIVSKCFW